MKLYTATIDLVYDVKICIDHEIASDDLLSEVLDYYGEADDYLVKSYGHVGKAFVLLVAEEAARACIRGYGLNSYGVMKYFETAEGFFPLDGSRGVYLVHCDEFEFDYYVNGVEELTEAPELPKPNYE